MGTCARLAGQLLGMRGSPWGGKRVIRLGQVQEGWPAHNCYQHQAPVWRECRGDWEQGGYQEEPAGSGNSHLHHWGLCAWDSARSDVLIRGRGIGILVTIRIRDGGHLHFRLNLETLTMFDSVGLGAKLGTWESTDITPRAIYCHNQVSVTGPVLVQVSRDVHQITNSQVRHYCGFGEGVFRFLADRMIFWSRLVLRLNQM